MTGLSPHRLLLALLCTLSIWAITLAIETLPAADAQGGYHFTIDQLVVAKQQDKVTLLVSASDPAGKPITGLTTFTALVDGTRVPVESATPIVNQRAGIAVLLLMDISGSMEGEKLTQAKLAASALVNGLLAQDVGALVSFAGSVAGKTGFTSDHAVLLGGVSGLATEAGGTALYDAVIQGLEMSGAAPVSRRAIVLLTDGQDSGASHSGLDQVLRSASVTNTPIFAIGLGQDADTETLRSIATAAHGNLFTAPTASDLASIFDTIGGRLRSQYEIVLPIPTATLTSRHIVIETRVGSEVLHAEGQFSTSIPSPKGKSSSNRIWFLVAAAAIALPILLVAARRIRLRRRPLKSPVAGGPGSDLGLPVRTAQPDQNVGRQGKLTVIEGPDAGRSVVVSAAPISIGTDPSSDLRLQEDSPATAGAPHIRVWLQNNRLVVHRLPRTDVSGGPRDQREWESLEPNEAIRIGSSVVLFSLEEDERS